MRFNRHSELEGKHAFLSPSSYHWLRYSDEKLLERYSKMTAKERGTKLHELAAQCIKLGVKLDGDETLAMYVNDAIEFGMTPEQSLYFSEYCFGTADAVSFRNGLLRIHDLKTGETEAKMDQLEIYAAIFCLEYEIRPSDIGIELRIYQSNQALVYEPDVTNILPIMDQIVYFDDLLRTYSEIQ